MKVLAILGSPRKGNSEILLTKAIDLCAQYGHEINLVKSAELNISGCTACEGCKDTGQCIIHDDMDRVYPLLRQAHRVIIASPIFFFGIPGQLKLLIDRCQCFWYEKYVSKKPIPETEFKRKALLVLVGGMKKGEVGVKCAETTLGAFLKTININEHNMLYYLGFDKAGAIIRHPTVINDIIDATIKLIKHD